MHRDVGMYADVGMHADIGMHRDVGMYVVPTYAVSQRGNGDPSNSNCARMRSYN